MTGYELGMRKTAEALTGMNLHKARKFSPGKDGVFRADSKIFTGKNALIAGGVGLAALGAKKLLEKPKAQTKTASVLDPLRRAATNFGASKAGQLVQQYKTPALIGSSLAGGTYAGNEVFKGRVQDAQMRAKYRAFMNANKAPELQKQAGLGDLGVRAIKGFGSLLSKSAPAVTRGVAATGKAVVNSGYAAAGAVGNSAPKMAKGIYNTTLGAGNMIARFAPKLGKGLSSTGQRMQNINGASIKKWGNKAQPYLIGGAAVAGANHLINKRRAPKNPYDPYGQYSELYKSAGVGSMFMGLLKGTGSALGSLGSSAARGVGKLGVKKTLGIGVAGLAGGATLKAGYDKNDAALNPNTEQNQ